jgi:hypothetical protein
LLWFDGSLLFRFAERQLRPKKYHEPLRNTR